MNDILILMTGERISPNAIKVTAKEMLRSNILRRVFII
jgi:hypothetical protein